MRSYKAIFGALMALALAAGLGYWWTRSGAPDTSLRRAEAPWVATAPTIDGTLGDLAWDRAPRLGPFVLSTSGERAPLSCTARFAWDDQALYVAFEVIDHDLIAKHRRHDAELWTQDVVELFIDPDGDGRDYMELQMSPRGVTMDARFPSYRKDLARSIRWDAEGFVAAARVEGSVDDPRDIDKGFTAEWRIPFTAIAPGARAPAPGDTWRVNLYRIDIHAEGGHYTAWTPPLRGDFHALDRLGFLEFTH